MVTKPNLEVIEGTQQQGSRESLIRTITTTPWASDPTNPTFKVYLDSTGVDVTDIVMPGTATVNGDVITLPKLKSLTKEKLYRVEVNFTAGLNDWTCYFMVRCTV